MKFKYLLITISILWLSVLHSQSLQKLKSANKIAYNQDNITSEYNELKKITFFHSLRNTKTGSFYGNGYDVDLYIGKKDDGTKYLRLYTLYRGEEWIDFDKFELLGDNGVQLIIYKIYPNKKTELSNEEVTEWSDNNINVEEAIELNNANIISYRFIGKFIRSEEMNKEQRQAFREIIEFYEKL